MALQHISLKTCNTCLSFSLAIPLYSASLKHQVV